MTADAADDLLGDLKIALAAPTKIIFLSLFAIIFTVFSTIACTLKQERAESNSSSLLSSTHQEEEHIEEADRNSDLADWFISYAMHTNMPCMHGHPTPPLD